jgi:3-oxoacyl-[acyl-carrier protein] reductase
MAKALVSGGGYGVGRAVAVALVRAGFDVTVLGRSRADLERSVARMTEERPGSHEALQCDLSDEVQIRDACGLLDTSLGDAGLSVFVHAAFGHVGEDVGSAFGAVSEGDLRDFCSVSVLGTWLITRGLLPMLQRAGGRAIFIGADWGFPMHNVLVASPDDAEERIGSEAYVAAKYAITGLVSSLELQSRIRALGIYPGVIASARNSGEAVKGETDSGYFDIDTPDDAVLEDGYEPGSFIPLRDVAKAVVFASEISSTVRSIVLKPSGFDYIGV